MPLKPGYSQDVIDHNVKEMIKAGHPKPQAVAAALASARKHKKAMATGGMVDAPDMDSEAESTLREMGDNAEPSPRHDQHMMNPAETHNQMDEDDHQVRSLGELQSDSNFKSDRDLAEAIRKYSQGGLVQKHTEPGELGNKPALDLDDGTEEPMSSMPSKPGHSFEAPAKPEIDLGPVLKQMLMDHKKRRKY